MSPTWSVVVGVLLSWTLAWPAAAGNPWRSQADYYGSDVKVMPELPPSSGFGKVGEEARFPPEDAEKTLGSPAQRQDPVYPPMDGAYPPEIPSLPSKAVQPQATSQPSAMGGATAAPPIYPPAPVTGQIAPGSTPGAADAGGVPTVGYSVPTWGASPTGRGVVPAQPYSGYPAYGTPYGYGYTAPGTGYDPLYWNSLNPGAANTHGWGRPGLGVPGFLGGTPWVGSPGTGWLW